MIVLFRRGDDLKSEEVDAASVYFPVTYSRCELQGHKLVIPRYSALPFYRELEHDLHVQGARLLNSYAEHSYIANFDWYHDLTEFTPKTWFRLHEVDRTKGPYVLKGVTNSRKQQWGTMMYAKDFEESVQVHIRLMNDPLIGSQGVVIRQFETFKSYETALNGQPITNEWRVFCYREHVLAFGYYWSSHEEHAAKGRAAFETRGFELLQHVKRRLADRVSFYVVDLAEREDGTWRLVEVNDGQMSGLSMCGPDLLYHRLKEVLDGERQGRG